MNQNNNNEPVLIGIKDVCKLLGVKQSRAYGVIRKLNEKLESEGKITISGRINKNYLLMNFGINCENKNHEK